MNAVARYILTGSLFTAIGAAVFIIYAFIAKQFNLPTAFMSAGSFAPFVLPAIIGALSGLVIGLLIAGLRGKVNKLTGEEERLKDIVREKSTQLNNATEMIEQMNQVEVETQREKFFTQLEKEWLRAMRNKKPLSYILCQIGGKSDSVSMLTERVFNEEVRDRIINLINHIIKRPADMVIQYEGTIFAVMLPDTPLDGASKLARDLRMQILLIRDTLPGLENLNVPISVGVSSCVPNRLSKLDVYIEAAENALEQSREEGFIVVKLPCDM